VKRSILGVLLVLTFVAVGIAAAPPLTFTFSDVIANKTATETDSYGVNNAGVIVGDYVDASGVQHGMILAGKKLTTVNNKTCQTTGATAGSIAFYAINKAGAAVGWCINSTTGIDEGFVYAKGKFTAINFPKSTGTQATGINDKGEVVGLYLDSSAVQHGFSKIGKKYKTIDVSGDTSTAAYGVNNAGQVCVYAFNSAGGYDSFLYNGKTFKKIADPNAGTAGTVCHAPNNKGDIAGTYFDASGFAVGFLYHGGKYFDLKDPKASNSTRNDGINDKLEMVGRYTPTAGGNFGYKVITK
jgi:hypothetical protein